MTNDKPVATAEQYERAIQRAEQVFRRNKSRMHVLRILRSYIKEEAATE